MYLVRGLTRPLKPGSLPDRINPASRISPAADHLHGASGQGRETFGKELRMTFEQWKKQVDREITSRVGLSADDLPDIDYRGLFMTKNTPRQAAVFAIRNAADLDTDDEEMPF
jgi:hypothetical protein